MDRLERTSLMRRILEDAERISRHFGLAYRGIVPEHPSVRSRYGACYADGLIKIRLNHAISGKPLKYSSLIDTLCHELAHLKHFNHGAEFKDFFLQILRWARREGIYRPGPPGRPSPAPRVRVEAPFLRLQPPSRNGQPVFPEFERTQATVHPPPWERYFTEAIRGRGRLAEDGDPAEPRRHRKPAPVDAPPPPRGATAPQPNARVISPAPINAAPRDEDAKHASQAAAPAPPPWRRPEQLSLF